MKPNMKIKHTARTQNKINTNTGPARRLLQVGAAGLLSMTSALCALLSVPGAQAQKAAAMPPSTPAARIADADNRFGLRLFEAFHKADIAKNADSNVCISPLSIALALQMTYNGANGTTKAAMTHALELNGMTLDDVNRANEALLNALPSSGQMRPQPNGTATTPDTPRLEVANSLWLRDARDIRPDFIQRTQTFYNAQVSGLAGAPDTINAWVNTHTRGKIKKIVSPADVRDAFAVLVNAVYFKAAWAVPFYKDATTDKPFHLASGATHPSKMMAKTQYFDYYADEGLQMVSLPYRECDLDMVILLPGAQTKLSAFLPQLTLSKWQQWTAKMKGKRGTVELPRFRVEYGVDCSDALTALGMGEAFKPTADFAAMSRVKPLYISKVIHKTYVNVDEEGTEAAAATAVVMAAGSAAPVDKPFQMTMDRPFLYAIRDRQTGALLFVGTLANPG